MNFSSELLNKGNKTPAFSISIEGRDITTVLDNRLMSLTLTDNRGFEADQLDLELDDADGKIVLPRRGAVITLALGWKGQPLFPKGAFTVDEIEHTGAPDRLTIRARSADFRETLNTRTDCCCSSTSIARWSGAYEFLRKRTCYGRFLFIWDLTRFKKMYKARLIYDDCAFHPGCRYF